MYSAPFVARFSGAKLAQKRAAVKKSVKVLQSFC